MLIEVPKNLHVSKDRKIRKLVFHLNRFPQDKTALKALKKFMSYEVISVLMTVEDKFAETVINLVTSEPSNTGV